MIIGKENVDHPLKRMAKINEFMYILQFKGTLNTHEVKRKVK